jgi:tRNA dimethylallyltransferase
MARDVSSLDMTEERQPGRVADLKGVFFIVGPTATGKSELAADVAARLGAEIVNADAFQVYRGLDLLTARPDAALVAKVPHHLLGIIPVDEEMNAEKFRRRALAAVEQIRSRGKLAIVVGGNGLYIKALTHGLSPLPSADVSLRTELDKLGAEELFARLSKLDPEAARRIDTKNRRRLVRALEICVLTGAPASGQKRAWSAQAAAIAPGGTFVFRDREELYARIAGRVEAMFEKGVIEEVRGLGASSPTVGQTIGLREIRELIDGRISMAQCLEQIQQGTRRYAKRQLTWFRRQTSFEPLNLSLLSHDQAVEWMTERAVSLSRRDDRNTSA